MKKYYQNLALGIAGALLLLITAFVGGAYIASNKTSKGAFPSPSLEVQQDDTKPYTNERWNFSVRYPADLQIKEEANLIAFGFPGEPFTNYNIQVQETPFTSTEEWLNAQPKGGFTSEGYEPVLWLDFSQKTAIVAEYVEYDRKPNGSYVHGRYFYAVRVDNGILYKFHVGGAVQFEEQGTPRINLDALNFVHSFKPYVE